MITFSFIAKESGVESQVSFIPTEWAVWLSHLCCSTTYVSSSLKSEHVPTDHRESQFYPALTSLRKPSLFKETLKIQKA